MESQYEYDDDTFYAEIRRQILLLTSEDNEELLERKSFNSNSSCVAANGGSIRSVYNSLSEPASQFCPWETERSGSPPDWLVKLWKNEVKLWKNEKGKGTGVFIPQAVTCRKKHGPGTMNTTRRQIYRPVVKN